MSERALTTGETRTADGVRLAYSLRPGDARRRVALIHSLALDRSVWDGVADRLAAQGAEVLAYDARGHGASDRPPGPYSVALFASDLAALLDAVGWDSALVAGASMGGSVALAFAVAYPARLRALGLIDTTAWYGADAPKAWEERAQKAAADGFSAMVGFQTTRWFSDGFREQRPDVVKRYSDLFVAGDVAAYGASCRMLGGFDLRERLAEIRVPTAIVVGEEDYATPVAMSEALHAGIAGSTLRVLDGARHLTPIEAPDRIAPELERLLSTVAA
jgi:3-oxoadipate enol-lactonase